LLCKSIPPSGPDERSSPRREKYQGANEKLSRLGAAGILALGVVAVSTAFATLMKVPTFHYFDRYLSLSFAIASCHAVCLVCDWKEKHSRQALLSGLILIPLTMYLITHEPGATFMGGGDMTMQARNWTNSATEL
jgi:hypothetical protein